MPPKRKSVKKANASQRDTKYTLGDAVKHVNSLKNPQSTKQIVIRNLTTIVANYKKDPEYARLTADELYEKYNHEDLVPLVKDFEGLTDLIENGGIRNKLNGGELAIDTKKQYYVAISYLFIKGPGRLELDADLIKKYREKIKEWHSYSNERRRLKRPKRGNLEHPDATWEFFQRGYEEYLDSTPFTNTEKGRRDLKAAALVGFYTIQRPRRVEDWFLLEYHTRLPVEADREGKNILHIEGETSTIYLDKFKTRWRTVNNKKRRCSLRT
jgi:hypothetical protein